MGMLRCEDPGIWPPPAPTCTPSRPELLFHLGPKAHGPGLRSLASEFAGTLSLVVQGKPRVRAFRFPSVRFEGDFLLLPATTDQV
jgi:hypothetical protein